MGLLLLEPLLHLRNVVFVRLDDILGDFSDIGILAESELHLGDVDRALMQCNHALYEVGIGIAQEGQRNILNSSWR